MAAAFKIGSLVWYTGALTGVVSLSPRGFKGTVTGKPAVVKDQTFYDVSLEYVRENGKPDHVNVSLPEDVMEPREKADEIVDGQLSPMREVSKSELDSRLAELNKPPEPVRPRVTRSKPVVEIKEPEIGDAVVVGPAIDWGSI